MDSQGVKMTLEDNEKVTVSYQQRNNLPLMLMLLYFRESWLQQTTVSLSFQEISTLHLMTQLRLFMTVIDKTSWNLTTVQKSSFFGINACAKPISNKFKTS